MQKIKLLPTSILIWIILVCLPISSSANDKSRLRLTPEESAWLSDHKKIVVGGEMDWAPFDFVDENGQYMGIANDYLKIIGEKLAIEIEIITGLPWHDLLEKIRKKEIDVLPAIYHSEEREEFVRFTAPYMKLTEFIFGRTDDETISSFADLKDKTTVVVKGHTIEGVLRSNHPEYDLVTVLTIPDALKKLITGEADAFIGDIITASYNVKELSLVGIKPIAPVPFKTQTVHMAIRKDWPILRNVLDKALKAIPEREHSAIKNRWIAFAEGKIEEKRSKVLLTPKEQAWLTEHPDITLAFPEQYEPYIILDQDGSKTGILVDILAELNQRLGTEIQLATGLLPKILAQIKEGELDGILALHPEYSAKLGFLHTQGYIKAYPTLFGHRALVLNTPADLAGKKIVHRKGEYYSQKIIDQYGKGAQILGVDSLLDGLRMVDKGEADVFVGVSGNSYIISKYQLSGIIPKFVFFNYPDYFGIGVRSDWPQLVSILNKGLGSFSDNEMRSIITKWIQMPQMSAQLSRVELSAEEKDWLADHPQIRVHNETASPPFNFAEHGRPKGFSIDYMRLLAEKIGVRVEFVTGPSWDEFQAMLKSGDLDVLLNIAKTPERQDYMAFTPTYMTLAQTLYTREDFPRVTSIEDLYGKRIAVPKGFVVAEWIRAYPQIEVLEVRDIIESIHAVSVGKADALYEVMSVVNYLLNKHQITNLKVGGDLGVEADRPMPLHLAVPKKDAVFAGILSKGMALITDEEFQTLSDKWLGRVTDKKDRIALTDTEQKWLANHRDIRLGADPNWPPYDFIDASGKHSGLAADVLALLSERLGINFRLVSGLEWSQVLDAARTQELDVISVIKETPERAKYLNFTSPTISTPFVIVTSRGFKPVTNLGDMTQDRVAMVKDYAIFELSQKAYPNLTVRTVESPLAGLQAVSSGSMDAYVGNLGVVSYLIQQKGLVNLKIAAEAGVASRPFAIGVRSDWPELVSILNKGLASISREEMNAIHQKWVPIEMGVSTPKAAGLISSKQLFAYGVAVFLIISLLALILIKVLRRENIAISFGSSWFRGLVLAGLTIFVIVVAFLGWYNLERNKVQQLQDIDQNLKGALSIGEDRLSLWLQERLSAMERIGRDPELVAITRRLLQVDPGKDILLKSDELRDARSFFKDSKGIFSNIGFFIINPAQINIGSMRDTNIGTHNLIARSYPKLLHRAFQGEVGFVPPMTSDVDLGNSSKTDPAKKPSTMFFIGPVKDTAGKILAVMTLRVNPVTDFARALTAIASSETGETYALDRNGSMLSPSRFEGQLRRIGLLSENQSSALNIEVRDPGVNMVAGQSSKMERSQQPLTLLASKAVALREQMEWAGIRHGISQIESNIEGYRDYRGVPVFGAWLWNAGLDIGLGIEIDVDEAMGNYYQTRVVIFSILGFTLLLSVGAILFVLIVGERTSRALMLARDNLEGKVTERTSELTKKEEQLSAAINSMAGGIFMIDKDLNFQVSNKQFCELYDFPKELAKKGKSFSNLLRTRAKRGDYGPGDPEELLTTRLELYNDPTQIKQVVRYEDKIPGNRTAEVDRAPTKNGGLVFVINDVTDRKQADAELKASMERFRVLFEQTSDAYFIFSDDGIIDCNNAAVEMLRADSKEDLLGRAPSEFSPEFQPDGRRSDVAGSGVDVLAREKGSHRFEWSHRKLDGEEFPVEATLTPVTLSGKPVFLGVWHDLTEQKQQQEAIERINFLSDIALELSQSGYWHVDFSDPDYYQQSERAANILGEPIKEDGRYHLQDNWFSSMEAANSETAKKTAESYQGAIDGKYPRFDSTFAYRRPIDGKIVWIHAAGKIVHDENDKIRYMYGVYQDITDRKKANEKLQREHQIRTVLNELLNLSLEDLSLDALLDEAIERITSIPRLVFESRGAIFLMDSETDTLVLKAHRGLHPSLLEQCALVAPGTCLCGRAASTKNLVFENHLNEKHDVMFDGITDHGHYCVPILSLSKQVLGVFTVYVEAGHQYLEDEASFLKSIADVLSGVIERKNAEIALRESKGRIQAVIDGVQSLVFIKDREGRHLLVNSYFEEAFGISKEQVIGKTDLDIFPSDVAEEIMAVDQQVVEEGKMLRFEATIPHKDGSVHIHLTEKFPLFNANLEVYGLCGLATDITHQKDIEKELKEARQIAENATQAKSDFLANMSHEIRTPMNAIIGMSHLALKTDLSPKQNDYVNKIDSAANSLLGIINDILDFSKIEAGKLDIESVPFNLDELLDNVANLVSVKSQEKGLELLFDIDREVPRELIGDSLRLGQVLINLSNNAVKFTDLGQIVISADVEKREGQEVELKFAVKDSGIGLTEEQQGRLFQAFSQADTSTTRKYGGTGLGLTISKRLANLMGGDIWVESVYGEGASFIFTVKYGLGEAKPLRALTPDPDLRGLKTLVVDDNETSREILQDILESMSFEVALSPTGQEGASAVEEADKSGRPFGLVLMDWKMPEMDGLEASRLILHTMQLKTLPKVIMVTAYGRPELRQQAEQLGLDGFLIKPVTPSTLFDTIMAAFGKEVERTDRRPGTDIELAASIQGAHLLLVEDNEINQQVAQEILEDAGLKVTIAENGQEAVDMVAQESFDAVLMDIQMPVMDGFEATRKIRKGERFKDLPIIAITASAMTKDREDAMAAGMNDHVSKPIDVKTLFAVLARFIKARPGSSPPATPAVKQATPAPTGEIPLPDSLPGISLKAGLGRVNNKESLYRKILKKFYTDYEKVAEEILGALEAEDAELARRLAHTVKGVAGNIGAHDLQEIAATLEEAIKQEDPFGVGSALEDFGPVLEAARSALRPYVVTGVDDKQPLRDAAAGETGDLQKLRELLKQLKPHVAKRKPKPSKAVLKKISAFTWPSDYQPALAELLRLVGKYKFKDSQVVIEELLTRLEDSA